MSRDINALDLSHKFISENVKEGSLCIDATAGRGYDSLFLANLVGDSGKVTSLDIQKEAIDSTKELLAKNSVLHRVETILDGHENIRKYASDETVSCITFNLGWLPGGDHSIFTLGDSSVKAIEEGLKLLEIGGIMSICIYYGRDMGDTEKDAVLNYAKTIDYNRYTVLVTDFTNRPNNPPIPVFIIRNK